MADAANPVLCISHCALCIAGALYRVAPAGSGSADGEIADRTSLHPAASTDALKASAAISLFIVHTSANSNDSATSGGTT
jgi:hypothetical protein